MREARAKGNLPLQAGLDMDRIGVNPHTVERRVPLTSLIQTRDPENIKTILSTHVSHWELGEIRRDIMSAYVGTGLLTNEGHAWKHSRSRLRPQFSQVSVGNLARYEDHVQALLLELILGPDRWTEVTDRQPLFLSLTLDVATEFFYGQSVHSQDSAARPTHGNPGNSRAPYGAVFGDCIDVATAWVYTKSVLGMSIPGYPYNWVPARRFKRSLVQMRAIVDWYVQRAVDRAAAKSVPGAQEPSRFVLLDELAKTTDDKLWLRNETIGLLAGGRATAAATLGWLFFYLARQPCTYHKLRRSLVEEFGTEYVAGQTTASQLRASHYFKQCMYKALRLGSATYASVRSAATHTTLPQGGGPGGEDPIYIAKGTVVMLNLFNLHHRADIWGDDVEEFKPERWDRFDRGWDFLPFGGGPRACIGRKSHTPEMIRGAEHLRSESFSPPSQEIKWLKPRAVLTEELLAVYPEVLVILNTRHSESWHTSMVSAVGTQQAWPCWRHDLALARAKAGGRSQPNVHPRFL
ncbi:MAG: hypothetical protein Q9169_006713 [Polycauliona sp. 2 TL-2023]